ncbi:MAG: PKD domain-containing protein [bacterium]
MSDEPPAIMSSVTIEQKPPLDYELMRLSQIPVPQECSEDVFEALRSRLESLLLHAGRAGTLRTSSQVASGELGRVLDLEYGEDTGELSWSYQNRGDYDRTGEVGVSDVTPIAINYLADTDDGLGNDIYETWVDGDASGEVGVSDITQIALNFLNEVAGYEVLTSNSPAADFQLLAAVNLDELGGIKEAGTKLKFSLPQNALRYVLVRPVDSQGNHGADSDPVEIGQPPEVVSVSPLSGEASQEITFEAVYSGTEPVMLLWDLGEAATPSNPTGQNPVVTLSESEGDFDCSVVATNQFGSDEFEFTISVTVVPNVAPVASLIANPEAGNPPVDITLDAGASLDPDGVIVKYDWDYDGDGSYDAFNKVDPQIVVTYRKPGSYNPVVRVTDDRGSSATASAEVLINRPPTANFTVDVQQGLVPLTVNYNPASSFDMGGSLVSFEWDFDGDGIFDDVRNTGEVVQYTYESAGLYAPNLRVTDNMGATDEFSLGILAQALPVAVILSEDSAGFPPLTVHFDASSSFDDGGVITKYEWDWENNGSYDLDSLTDPTVLHIYTKSGLYKCKLRVTDNDGMQSTATIDVSVYGWIKEFIEYGGTTQLGQNVDFEFGPDGTPTVVYQKRTSAESYILRFAQKQNDQWVISDIDDASGGACGSYASLEFDAEGNPLVAYQYSYESLDTPLSDLKVSWWDGSQWNGEIVDGDGPGVGLYGVDASLDYFDPDTAAIVHRNAGQPNDCRIVRWNGTSWNASPMPSAATSCSLIHDSSGNPVAFLYTIDSGGIPNELFESFWWTGSSWSRKTVDSGTENGKGEGSLALDASGNPAIAWYWDSDVDDLLYASWTGTDWASQVVFGQGAVAAGKYNSLKFDSDGNPCIAFYDSTDRFLKFAKWNGSGWDVTWIDDGDGWRRVGEYCSLDFDANGVPHVAYFQNQTNEYGLKFAKYFVP